MKRGVGERRRVWRERIRFVLFGPTFLILIDRTSVGPRTFRQSQATFSWGPFTGAWARGIGRTRLRGTIHVHVIAFEMPRIPRPASMDEHKRHCQCFVDLGLPGGGAQEGVEEGWRICVVMPDFSWGDGEMEWKRGLVVVRPY